MQATCPRCGQALRVPDDLAGKRVKCPKCQTVLLLSAPRPAPAPAPQAAPPPSERGLKLADEPQPDAATMSGFTPGDKPVCYLTKDNDQLRAVTRILERLREVLPEEGLDLQFADLDLRYAGEPNLRPGDIHVTGSVAHADHGSRMMRYFLTPLSLLFGVGACKIEVNGELRQGSGGGESFTLKASQGIGIFGGPDDGLMELNLKSISRRFAGRIARRLTGRWILNTTAHTLAKAALVCGLLGLIPVLGLILAVPTFILAGLSLGTIFSRGLQKGKVMAIIGASAAVVGIAISIAVLSQG